MKKIHITPINDLKVHEEDVNCNCKPKIEHINNTLLVIHNAYDRRESLEKVQRQNLEYLKLLYSKNKITKNEIQELITEAIEDEEYEVVVSIRDLLNNL